MIAGVEFRSEQDPDVRRHVHPRMVQEVIVQASNEVGECRQWLMQTLTALLTKLMNAKVSGRPSRCCLQGCSGGMGAYIKTQLAGC